MRKFLLRRWMAVAAAAVVVASLGLAGEAYYSSRPVGRLTAKDTVVLAEFNNRTGEPIFDGTLRQALAAQLDQSPFLNLLSDNRIGQTLALMARPKDIELTEKVALEVCQRTASTAAILGSIARLGSQYVIGLKTINCRTGDWLDDEQVIASSKERVIRVLGEAAARMRERLGESLSSVQKYGAPADGVTTPSLDALNAYSLGLKSREEKGVIAAIPFFRQAVQFDPNFAMAYRQLGVEYSDLGYENQANQNLEKAFALRDRVSRREAFSIASAYNDVVTGDLQKADEIHLLWSQTYPQDATPLDWLGNDYIYRGLYSQALEALQREERVAGSGFYNYHNLVVAYLGINRVQEARLAVERAQTRNMEPISAYGLLYLIDFLEANASGMRADLAWAAGRSGIEDMFLDMQSDTEAYQGHRQEAWNLSKLAVSAAQRDNKNEIAARYFANAALHEAECGNSTRALKAVNSALQLAPSRGIKTVAALALARAGFVERAQALANELANSNPSSTILNFYWLPVIRAGVALHLNRPAQALELLKLAASYELGQPDPLGPGTLYPAYVRGEAYLRLKQGRQAAEEFQKLLAHPGCVLNYVLGALARLDLGRAQALAGDKSKARSAYDEFFGLWENADPDIPILKQAQAEYRKLRR